MATVLEIIQGLQQAAANAYDGAHDERFVPDGEVKEIGALSREEGCAINDSRIMDGFGIKIMGDMLQVNYQAEIKLKDVYARGFEEECERRINEIVKFLTKEFKAITGSTVSLTPQGEARCFVQNMSRVRTSVNATRVYKIGNMEEVLTVGEATESTMDAKFQKFLDQGGFEKE
tara:strand:+ start:2045 stop:2566 length:522 start_codon:yes stop_codon:yes gene_type:complete